MHTLEKIYNKLISCTARWSYYDCPPLLSRCTLFSENDSFEFIKAYFTYGRKATVFEDEYINRNSHIIKKRAPHIVSTYLLGIIISESLGLFGSNRSHYQYLWFLTCLYHDIGYIYEKTRNYKFLKEVEKNGLTGLKKICDIQFYEASEFTVYSENEVDSYLSYRAKSSNGEMGVVDHGIAGGLMLYDRLRKIYERGERDPSREYCTENSFYLGGLYFSKEHFSFYAEAADAIISHNIWAETLKKCLKSKKAEYEHTRLITEKNKVAFLLALADTIEPIKKWGYFSLKEIGYCSTYNGFIMSMPFSSDKDIYGYITSLPEWVEIDVEEQRGNFFISRRGQND